MNRTPPPPSPSSSAGPLLAAKNAKRRTPGWRRPLPLIGGAVLLALIVVGLWPRAIPVEVAEVSRGPLVVTVDEEGMTRVRNRYVVSTPVAGELRRIDWKAGAAVEAGKTALAVLEASGADFLDTRSRAQAEARVKAAEAAREAASAQRERAQAAARMFAADFERVGTLREREALSAQEFDVAQMRSETAAQDVRASEFAAKVAEFELEQARAVLSRGERRGTAADTTDPANAPGAAKAEAASAASGAGAEPLVITSPVSGKILRVFQESGRVVPAGFPLMEVGDPTDLEVRIEVLSRDGVAIAPGARVWLEQWGGAAPLEARVRHVEPSAFTKISALGVEEQRVYAIADLTDPVERRPSLGDSYRVEARIVTWEKADALRAPAGALFRGNGRAGSGARGSEGWQVFVVEGGRARTKTVEAGRTNGMDTEILDGLTEGAQAIVYPGDKVKDGTRVEPLRIGGR